MRWSFRLGTVSGIGVYIHATFFILIGWIFLVHWLEGYDTWVALQGVAFILSIFACVLLHEFGHSLMARRFDIKTRDITLLPIGGLARLERMPTQPLQELWVALAGPAVNIVIASLIYTWLVFSATWEPLSELTVTGGSFLERLMLVNIFLVIFNLIPAFPMDGGRVVRAFLASFMDYTTATQIAASLGQGIALVFGFIGFFFNPFLIFIALFVWIGAAQESSMVQMKSALGGIPVKQAMLTNFNVLRATDTLASAVELILSGSQQDFPVMEHGRVVGILTRGDLLVALARQGQETPVSEVMRTDVETVDACDMLESVFPRMHSTESRTMLVLDHGELAGLLTLDNVGEFIMIQSALRSAPVSRIYNPFAADHRQN
ncbi:MAG TPA: site-2 protease family protein [bacterium]|nr:site-2 protease family protein [Candidatus Omnitrophota bacterium]HOJ62687.1 site-2 protease family protein [bacterium]